MKAQLKDVTLVCVDTTCHELTAMAVNETLERCAFADVLLFSDKPLAVPGVAARPCEVRSLDEAQKIIWYQVPQLVKSTHFLIIQWDGYVLDPSRWNNSFLEYDYVGAPWWYFDDMNVGNGGFSLRSLALAKHIASDPEKYVYKAHEDQTICRDFGPGLRQAGFKWPSTGKAMEFAFEWVRGVEGTRYFGFHDARNFPLIMNRGQLGVRMALMRDNHYLRQKNILDKINSLATELGDQCGYLSRAWGAS